MRPCVCEGCPRAKTPEIAAKCKAFRDMTKATLDKVIDHDAWEVVYNDLRPPLGAAILAGNWEKVADIWLHNQWMVEMAVLGK